MFRGVTFVMRAGSDSVPAPPPSWPWLRSLFCRRLPGLKPPVSTKSLRPTIRDERDCKRLIWPCLILAVVLSPLSAQAVEIRGNDLGNLVDKGEAFNFVVNPRNGNVAFVPGPHNSAAPMVDAGSSIKDISRQIRGTVDPSPTGWDVKAYPGTVRDRFPAWRNPAKFDQWFNDFVENGASRPLINARSARDVTVSVDGKPPRTAFEILNPKVRSSLYQAGTSTPSGQGGTSPAAGGQPSGGQPTGPTGPQPPGTPGQTAGGQPGAVGEPQAPTLQQPGLGTRVGVGAAAGMAVGMATTYVACMLTPGATSEQCFGQATGGRTIAESAFWGAVAATGPVGAYLTAVYGAWQAGTALGLAIEEGRSLYDAIQEGNAALAAQQGQQIGTQEDISRAMANCDFVRGLNLARGLRQRSPQPAWLQTVLPNLENGAKAQTAVNSLLAQAAAVSDPTQKRKLLNQALSAAANIPCLITRVRQALNVLPPAEPSCIYVLDVSGGSVWVGTPSELKARPACSYSGGGPCSGKGNDPPPKVISQRGCFPTPQAAEQAWCRELQGKKITPFALTGDSKALVYGGNYWLGTAPACPSAPPATAAAPRAKAAESPPPIAGGVTPEKCKGLQNAMEAAADSQINWRNGLSRAQTRQEQLQQQLHDANVEAESLKCGPRRDDGSTACKSALVRRDAALAELRVAEANRASVERAAQAANARVEAAERAWSECVAGNALPAAAEQPKPPAPPTSPLATETFVPRVLPPGTYQALLWTGMSLLQDFRRRGTPWAPHPVILTIDAGGGIVGTSRWKLSAADIDPAVANWAYATNEVSMRLEGKIDWSTGAITLRVVDGRKVWGFTDDGSTGPNAYYTALNHMEFEFSLSGWQLGHPALRKPLTDNQLLLQQHMPDRLGNLETAGLPNFERAAGRLTFRDFGWAGIPDFDPAARQQKKGLGGEARITIPKYYEAVQYKDGRRFQTDKIAGSDKKAWESSLHSWYLKILGPMTVAAEAKPASGAAKDPNGFAIWPVSPLRVRPGETFTLDAMAAYADDPYEAVKLNDRATWQMSNGVTRSGSNNFRAAAPGRYQVTATIRRQDGGTMSGTVDVIVGP